MYWLKKADVVVAEVSNPSLGVGYEIAHAEVMKKPLFCLYSRPTNYQVALLVIFHNGKNRYLVLNDSSHYRS